MQTLILFSVLICNQMALAADVNAGKRKSSACIECHGEHGISANQLWPNLAGQKDQYIVKQLKAFHDGVRHHALMTPIAKMLSEDDMQDLAAYFSQLNSQP
jgi:cytochrome c553